MNPEKITKNSAKSGHTGYNYRLFLAISTFVVIIIVASKRFIIRCPVVFFKFYAEHFSRGFQFFLN